MSECNWKTFESFLNFAFGNLKLNVKKLMQMRTISIIEKNN